MGCTIQELQVRMTSQEFTEWRAYSRVEPFGWEIENWRSAMIASAICNTIRASAPRGKGSRTPTPLTPRDFYPPMVTPEPQLTSSQREYLKRKHGERRNGRRGLRRPDGAVHSSAQASQ